MRPVRLSAVVGSVIVLLSGCSSAPQGTPSPRPSAEALGKTLTVVLSALSCDSVRAVATDITRFADSTGADCSIGDSEAYVRVYTDGSALDRSMRDWQPLASSTRDLYAGRGWLALGPATSMSRVAALAGARRIIDASDLPTAREEPQSEIELDSCVQFAASAFRDRLHDVKAYRSQRKNLENLYPGLVRFIDNAVRPRDARKAAALEKRDDNSSEAFLASFGPRIKTFCADKAGKP